MAEEGRHDARTALLEGTSTVSKKVRSAWGGFKEFALRDSVLEVAVGLIIAAAFTSVVNSLVSDIILPPISLLPFMSRNLAEKFIVLKKGPEYDPSIKGYNTRKQAMDDGAVILTYGAFFDKMTNFFGIGIVLYILANVYGYVSKDSIIKHTTKCPYCKKEISQKARRCALCTSWLDGREDVETSSLSRNNTLVG